MSKKLIKKMSNKTTENDILKFPVRNLEIKILSANSSDKIYAENG